MKTAEDWECMARLRRREVLNRHRAESFGAFLVSYRRECGRLFRRASSNESGVELEFSRGVVLLANVAMWAARGL
jgi:hypothetical protein